MGQASHRALVVDDEADIRELLEITLSRMQLETRAAANLAEARRLLEEESFQLCFTDMRLPDGNGIELVESIQQHHPELPVAVITAFGDVEHAVRALKAGAFDFVNKPVDLDDLRRLVNSALKLDKPDRRKRPRRQLIGQSPAMESLRKQIRKLARGQAPIFISGESGTGKEVIARLIHEQGPRREAPFVPVNCGAIPAELMESEFFGHRKGSFTGATADKKGLFQTADGGTLFLDEVADLPLHMQVKLLRAIQERSVRPVGDEREQPVDVRILSASHQPLERLVDEGRFRQDLYFRINVIQLTAPPLRERPEDIPELADHILGKLAEQYGETGYQLSSDALVALQSHPFPGNVRELENRLERAVTLNEDGTIHPDDLGLDGQADTPTRPASTPAGPTTDPEKAAILQALEQTRWNRTQAAKNLGLTLRQLRYRIQKMGIG